MVGAWYWMSSLRSAICECMELYSISVESWDVVTADTCIVGTDTSMTLSARVAKSSRVVRIP